MVTLIYNGYNIFHTENTPYHLRLFGGRFIFHDHIITGDLSLVSYSCPHRPNHWTANMSIHVIKSLNNYYGGWVMRVYH